jgi:hypothetical protein
MAVFEFKSAQELGRAFQNHGIKYLFFGKSGAIPLGYFDTRKMFTCMWTRNGATARDWSQRFSNSAFA